MAKTRQSGCLQYYALYVARWLAAARKPACIFSMPAFWCFRLLAIDLGWAGLGVGKVGDPRLEIRLVNDVSQLPKPAKDLIALSNSPSLSTLNATLPSPPIVAHLTAHVCGVHEEAHVGLTQGTTNPSGTGTALTRGTETEYTRGYSEASYLCMFPHSFGLINPLPGSPAAERRGGGLNGGHASVRRGMSASHPLRDLPNPSQHLQDELF